MLRPNLSLGLLELLLPLDLELLLLLGIRERLLRLPELLLLLLDLLLPTRVQLLRARVLLLRHLVLLLGPPGQPHACLELLELEALVELLLLELLLLELLLVELLLLPTRVQLLRARVLLLRHLVLLLGPPGQPHACLELLELEALVELLLLELLLLELLLVELLLLLGGLPLLRFLFLRALRRPRSSLAWPCSSAAFISTNVATNTSMRRRLWLSPTLARESLQYCSWHATGCFTTLDTRKFG